MGVSTDRCSDPFSVTFGSRRGVDDSAYSERERELARANVPIPVISTVVEGYVGIQYFLGNNSAKGLHRVDGPASVVVDISAGTITEEWWYKGVQHRASAPARIFSDLEGDILKEEWLENGQTHRVGAPALIEYCDGNIIKQVWYVQNVQDREDGPAEILYTEGGGTISSYYSRGRLHRDGDAAIVEINADGKIIYEEYWAAGFMSRDHGPALRHVDNEGKLIREEWWWLDQKHREVDVKSPGGRALMGPAVVVVHSDGSCTEEYWHYGRQHNETGPAMVEINADGAIISEEYWLEGEVYTREEWERNTPTHLMALEL
jgi:hypothetical protein